jgi:hypothetical protein
MISTRTGQPPEWTALGFHKCPNCTLDPRRHPCCPPARNLAPACEAFRHRVSCDAVDVIVRTEDRSYMKHCAMQEAFSSLMGLIMATSGCPHLDKLRPMVLTHLPFATWEQTTYRAVSMYLLAQYLRQQRGLDPDWQLRELARLYEDVRRVNMAFADRLRSIQQADANVNAMVKLDCQADITSLVIARQWWENLEPLFRPHLSGCGSGTAPESSPTAASESSPADVRAGSLVGP